MILYVVDNCSVFSSLQSKSRNRACSIFYVIRNYSDCNEFVTRKRTNLEIELARFFIVVFLTSFPYNMGRRNNITDMLIIYFRRVSPWFN